MNGLWRVLLQLTVAAVSGFVAACATLSTYAVTPADRPPPASVERLSLDGSGASPTALRSNTAITQPAHADEPVIVSYRAAVARAAPSVVTVYSARTSAGRLPLGPALSPEVVVKSLASGVVIESDGYIVTNHHVIADAPTSPLRCRMEPSILRSSSARPEIGPRASQDRRRRIEAHCARRHQ